jgi:hypothetical protein
MEIATGSILVMAVAAAGVWIMMTFSEPLIIRDRLLAHGLRIEATVVRLEYIRSRSGVTLEASAWSPPPPKCWPTRWPIRRCGHEEGRFPAFSRGRCRCSGAWPSRTEPVPPDDCGAGRDPSRRLHAAIIVVSPAGCIRKARPEVLP